MSQIELRKSAIYLIGHTEYQITGNKLPTNMQVMRVLLHNLRNVKLILRASAHLVVDEVTIFWKKSRLPVRKEQHCVTKVEQLYSDYRNIQRSAGRVSKTQQDKEKCFVENLNKLFDIAEENVFEDSDVSDDAKEFLKQQRQDGREGFLLKTRQMTSAIDIRKDKRINAMENRRKRSHAEMEKTYGTVELASTSSSGEEKLNSTSSSSGADILKCMNYSSQLSDEPMNIEDLASSSKKTQKSLIMTERLAAALDASKISNRRAVHIIAAVAESFDIQLASVVLSRNSIGRFREEYRVKYMKQIQENKKGFANKPAVVHWDGKILPSLTGNDKIDRLPIILCAEGEELFLGAPESESGSGKDEAEVVYETLEEWDLLNEVQAVCCDTTASNTGKHNGVCKCLELSMQRDLLLFGCRHHIAEVYLKAAFEVKFGPTTGPNVPFFKNFKDSWSSLDVTKYKPGIEDLRVNEVLKEDFPNILSYTLTQLQKKNNREDYREFLELIVIFLGEKPPRGISFRLPGAMHQARWMSKAIYTLKIFIFREVYSLTAEELNSCRDICIFLIKIYVKLWFDAPAAAKAPNNDLSFLKTIQKYEKVDSEIAQVVLKKALGHLWYLMPETAALSFFDEDISTDVKNQMRKALSLKLKGKKDNMKRINVKNVPQFLRKKIHNFISEESKNFFTRFGLKTSFLNEDASQWMSNEDFKAGLEYVNKLKVVNDVAERGVKLITDFNLLITKDEQQKQCLLQVDTNYRQQYPESDKNTLSRVMS